MKISELMITDVIQISPDGTIGEAAKRMREHAVGCLVATVNGVIKGIITDRDLLWCLHQRHDPYECQVGGHMSRPVVVLRPDEDHVAGIEVLRKKSIKRLPVARGGRLLGIVSLSDLAAVAYNDIKALRPSLVFIGDVIQTQSQLRNVQIRVSEPKLEAPATHPFSPDERRVAISSSIGA